MPPLLFLKPGDILLYRPVPFRWRAFWTWPFGQIISIKTWHYLSHVEIYDGGYFSWASRDGAGFEHYPLRLTELIYVLRPKVALDLTKGRAWAASMIGTPYGWADLLNFVGWLPVDGRGIVCSPAAAGYLRACGWQVFPEDPINKIAPFQFLDLIGADCTVVYSPATGPSTSVSASPVAETSSLS